jgi:S-formylglutathione hydrolase FrmB
MHPRSLCLTLTFVLATVFAPVIGAQIPAAPHGTVEVIKVHGVSLEGNLEGDSPDRQVSIYLPPSYDRDGVRRYPVIYLLATGDWENFIARELVAYVDSHYRTIPNRMSRGLAGHSMGGYGTLRIGMKHPDVFSSIYALSACCMMLNDRMSAESGAPSAAEAISSFEEFEKADFRTKAQFASAAVWSANPAKRPFFLDLPTRNGQTQPLILAKWAANAPLAMVDQYLDNLKQLKSMAFDAGDKDTAIASTTRTLDTMLTSYGVPHVFEIYDGNHVNRIADRVEQHVLPFFSNTLAVTPGSP